MKKRILSIVLVLAMCLTLLPMTAFATESSYDITNGTPESDKETNHGYIAIDKASVAEGDTVTVTVNPNEGYQLKSLIATPVVQISTIADVLATVEGFPESASNDISSGAWGNGDSCSGFIFLTYLILKDSKNSKNIRLDTNVTKGENCYTATASNCNLKFNMTDGLLTSFEFEATGDAQKIYDGTYTPENTPSARLKPITPEKQTDGTYTFTMPAYGVTVSAEFEEIPTPTVTISDILPDNFPLCVDVLPFNTWDNDNGIHMMLIQNTLGLITDESQNFVIAEDIRSAALTRSGNNYIFTNNGVTTTFVMSGNTLVSVEVSGLDDEYDSFNGTYAAEMSVVIDDEEAGTIASVAKDANGLNLSGISGGTILLLEPKDISTNKVVEVHYTKADGGNGYAETRFSINQGYEFIGLSIV